MVLSPSANCYAIWPSKRWTTRGHLLRNTKLPPNFSPDSPTSIRNWTQWSESKLGALGPNWQSITARKETRQDSIAVELPKGSYLLGFHPRNGHAKSLDSAPQFDRARPTPANQMYRVVPFFSLIAAFSLLLIASLVGLFSAFSRKPSTPRQPSQRKFPLPSIFSGAAFKKGLKSPA